jgi:hypothetical protein
VTEVARDRYGRPLIIPRDGGKPVAYARASSFGDVLEDKTNLEKWKLRKVAKGVANNPHISLAVSAEPEENKSALNKLTEMALDAAGGNRASMTGTSLHSLTEVIDRGQEPEFVPAAYQADLAAYREATKDMQMVHIERFMVCDELGIAGTPDRWFLEFHGYEVGEEVEPLHSGERGRTLRLGDLKTSTSDLKYQGSKFATQLAIYANSEFYDPATGDREPLPINVDRATGVIFHMPAGGGKCDLPEVDLVAGWEGVQLAVDVRKWRKRKGLLTQV